MGAGRPEAATPRGVVTSLCLPCFSRISFLCWFSCSTGCFCHPLPSGHSGALGLQGGSGRRGEAATHALESDLPCGGGDQADSLAPPRWGAGPQPPTTAGGHDDRKSGGSGGSVRLRYVRLLCAGCFSCVVLLSSRFYHCRGQAFGEAGSLAPSLIDRNSRADSNPSPFDMRSPCP